MKQQLTFTAATNNDGKLKEIQEILGSAGFGCRSLADAGLNVEVAETGDTFLENALLKARAIYELTGGAVLSDDSGLVVDALGGKPGVHTARYAGPGANSEANIDKLLADMDGLPLADRSARFVSVVAAILPNGEEITASGCCEGYIGFARAGENGFGYDPVFYLFNNFSLAQLSDKRKNQMSHRARAIRKLCFKLRGIEKYRGGTI